MDAGLRPQPRKPMRQIFSGLSQHMELADVSELDESSSQTESDGIGAVVCSQLL
jgi:hypothetical protein